jgi:hypothetical protein
MLLSFLFVDSNEVITVLLIVFLYSDRIAHSHMQAKFRLKPWMAREWSALRRAWLSVSGGGGGALFAPTSLQLAPPLSRMRRAQPQFSFPFCRKTLLGVGSELLSGQPCLSELRRMYGRDNKYQM